MCGRDARRSETYIGAPAVERKKTKTTTATTSARPGEGEDGGDEKDTEERGGGPGQSPSQPRRRRLPRHPHCWPVGKSLTRVALRNPSVLILRRPCWGEGAGGRLRGAPRKTNKQCIPQEENVLACSCTTTASSEKEKEGARETAEKESESERGRSH